MPRRMRRKTISPVSQLAIAILVIPSPPTGQAPWVWRVMVGFLVERAKSRFLPFAKGAQGSE